MQKGGRSVKRLFQTLTDKVKAHPAKEQEAEKTAEAAEETAAEEMSAAEETAEEDLTAFTEEAPKRSGLRGWLPSQPPEIALPEGDTLFHRMYRSCCYVGIQVLRELHMLLRSINHVLRKWKRTVPRSFYAARIRFFRLVEKFCDEMLFPYRILRDETVRLWKRLSAKTREAEGVTLRQSFRDFYRSTVRPANRIANFFAPIIGLAILFGVIGWFNTLSFGLKVEYNGEVLGYIAEESDFYEACDDMLERLINEEYIPPADTIPTLSLSIIQKEDLISREELTNAIMLASGNDLTNASGFYLEGKFLGAILDGNEFLMYLDRILSNYRTGEEHEVVQFTRNIRLEEGVYPVSSVMSLSTLQNYLRSDERLERTYTAIAGETVEQIAKRYGLSIEEMYEMNPELELYLTDLRIQVLGYDPESPRIVLEDDSMPAEMQVSTENLSTSLPKAGEDAALDAQNEGKVVIDGKVYDVDELPEGYEPEKPSVMKLEQVPLQGTEEFLVADIDVTLGIQVTRRETYTARVPYGTTYQDNNKKPTDYRVVLKAGTYGQEEITSDITYVDGKRVSETVLNRVRLSDPVNQVVSRGTLTLSEWLGENGGNYIWPADGGWFNGSLQSYGGHTGMDIACPIGTTVRASKAGTVTTALNYGWNYGYGRTVVINHGGGQITRYAHMSSVSVYVGQYVQQGQVLGYSGNSGNSSGPHLHFEIRIDGVIKAPENYIGYYYNRK